MAIKLKRDSAADWASENPTLEAGQPGYEEDTFRLKVGDGGTAYNSKQHFGSNAPIVSFSGAHSIVLANAGAILYHPTTDDNARTVTIPANGSVAFAVGTVITVVNEANTVTIAITTDTLSLMDGDTGGTGSVEVAANGIATLVKVASTRWIVSGVGVTAA